MVCSNGPMDLFMKDGFARIRRTAAAGLYIQMAMYTRASGIRTRLRGMASTLIKTAHAMRDNSCRINSMERVWRCGLTALVIKAIIMKA